MSTYARSRAGSDFADRAAHLSSAVLRNDQREASGAGVLNAPDAADFYYTHQVVDGHLILVRGARRRNVRLHETFVPPARCAAWQNGSSDDCAYCRWQTRGQPVAVKRDRFAVLAAEIGLGDGAETAAPAALAAA